MTFPDPQSTTVVEVAFGADLTADQSTWDWTDVTAEFHLLAQPIAITRGRQDEQSQVEPADCTLILDNRDGRYTPDQPMSPHYPDIVTGTPIRVTSEGSVRFVGTVSSWEPTWPFGDLSDLDDLTEMLDDDSQLRGESYVTVRAFGILQRMQEGSSPLRSALYRATVAQPTLLAYWPMEDGSDASILASPVAGVDSAQLSGGVTDLQAGGEPVAPGSGPSMRIDTGTGAIRCSLPSSSANGWCVETCLSIPSDTSTGDVWTLLVRDSGGLGNIWTVSATLAASTVTFTLEYQPDPEDSGSAVTMDTAVVDRGTFHQVRLTAARHSSGNRLWLWLIDDDIKGFASAGGSTEPTSVGNMVQADLLANGIIVGHLAVYDVDTVNPPPTWPAVQGWAGETATVRFDRLCLEEGIAHRVVPTAVEDTFTRTEVAAWGTADSGQAWTVHGTAAGYSVNSGQGHITAPVGVLRAASVDVDIVDVDVRFLAEAATLPDNLGADLRLETPGGNYATRNGYAVVLFPNESLTLFRLDDGTPTTLPSADLDADLLVAGEPFWLRAQIVGSTLRAKAWPDGTAEPALWAVTADDATYDAGRAGVFVGEGDGSFDDVTITDITSALMGPQQVATLVDNLQAAVDVDGGILYETRDELGLSFRPLNSLYNQAAALTLDASADNAGDITNPFAPVLDDSAARNDITVSRVDGSSARAVDTADVARRGLRDEQITLNVASDLQLPSHATWRLHIGTWPGMRYPSVSPALNHRPGLLDLWLPADLGDRIDVSHLPPQHPPNDVLLMLQGYTETITPTMWDVEVNASPYGPYIVATRGPSARVALTRTSAFATATTSHEVEMPTGIQEDDMLLVVIAVRVAASVPATPSGWSSLATDSSNFAVFAKVATGSESGTTVDFVTPNASTAAAVAAKITGAYPDVTDGLDVSTVASNAGSANPDSGTATAAWGATTNLFIAAAGWNDDDATVTSYPPGYGGGRSIVSGGGANAGAGAGLASRQLLSASDDPGAWVLDSSEEWDAVTIAVRPATDLVGPADPVRRDTAGSELNAGIDDNDTSLSVATTLGSIWGVTGAANMHFPFDINVGGERMRVTAIAGASSPQSFAVTRSINGVMKAHDAGTPVRLWQPAVRAL